MNNLADCPENTLPDGWDKNPKTADKWKSPVLMPRSASRILLTVRWVDALRVRHISLNELFDSGLSYYTAWQTEDYKKAVAESTRNHTKPPLGLAYDNASNTGGAHCMDRSPTNAMMLYGRLM